MKKITFHEAYLLLAGMLMPFFVASCYNQIEEEIAESDIPILITSNICPVSTRMSGVQFDVKDQIGVFLFADKKNLSEAYISNSPFTCNSSGVFGSDKALYYPAKEKKSQVVAYYPYSSSIIEGDPSLLNICVGKDQNTLENLEKSDFLLALKEEVRADYKPLNLDFNHKLAKVSISIKISDGYNIDQLLKAKPTVYLSNFPTTVKYSIDTKKYTEYGTVETIEPYIKWEKEEGRLTGCTAIVLPQNKLDDTQSITLEAEGVVYRCAIPHDLVLEGGALNKLELIYNPSKGIELLESSSSIQSWDKGKNYDLTISEIRNAIATNSFSFEQSAVLNVLSASEVVYARVFSEFLNQEELKVKATVIYPVIADQTQLDNGIILATEGSHRDLIGKNISWDRASNTFKLTDSAIKSVAYLFVDDTGKLCFEEPDKNNNIFVEPYLLVDQRGGELKTYPIQKIGTQLWMQKNLNTEYQNNGEKWAVGIDNNILAAGYSVDNGQYGKGLEKHYNFAAVESGQLIPKGWSLPTCSDWKKLLSYVSDNVNYLRMEGHSDWTTDELLNISGLSIGQYGVYAAKGLATSSTGNIMIDNGKPMIFIMQPFNRKAKLVEFRECGDKDYQSTIRCLQNL